ncbi:hypothetical protein EAS61_36985 [Bradyrhizobium zhanjiangense]|uniref:Uncharacterized protein n=1 Tax=Bradyrhizobium zhanjiangense TaxID=1325107 RepID=A0A4Q0Q7U9_9BRAD|nr:hypothetical protein EAS61_36985 [Bradyrhizobium zhanjiangense]RXG85396.1 hypothetical protein EAS62_38895 [Bradyrhizobium zhanjiangense]
MRGDRAIAQKTGKLAVGTRFKMSELGIIQFPELANKTGRVIEISILTADIAVLFDGAARPTVLDRSYIALLSE